ncbi:MAG: PASTA domain-containing protein [Myxococcales bacterium]|nr:PASTA domain-containing protein [Myxococcales bacterium]
MVKSTPRSGRGGPRGGRRPRKLVIPDVNGLRLTDAQIVLAQAGFAPATPRFVQSYDAENSVVSQLPARGMLVNADTPIELRVSKTSWMRFLPQIYQVTSTDESDLLLNYLWIFQQLHEGVSDRIDEMHRLFRPLEAEARFLPWLSSWIALHLEDDWSEEVKRRWLRHAPALYNIRGTKRALEELLEIYTGTRPTIIENEWPEGAFRVEVSSIIGESSTILPPMNLNNCFVVELAMSPDSVTDEQLIRIHRVIRAEKPAHCNYFLKFAEQTASDDWSPFMVIGEEGM